MPYARLPAVSVNSNPVDAVRKYGVSWLGTVVLQITHADIFKLVIFSVKYSKYIQIL